VTSNVYVPGDEAAAGRRCRPSRGAASHLRQQPHNEAAVPCASHKLRGRDSNPNFLIQSTSGPSRAEPSTPLVEPRTAEPSSRRPTEYRSFPADSGLIG
jgi:hypothetical protein